MREAFVAAPSGPRDLSSLKAEMSEKTPVTMSIAGSDSGGGAGIQADLKAFARCGVHGCSVVVALTAQNTRGVDLVLQIPAETIRAQFDALRSDLRIDSVKVGMLGSVETARTVVDCLEQLPEVSVVVDPVMISESGARLLEPESLSVLVEEILPRARVITPNLPEAAALLGRDGPVSDSEQEDLARALLEMGPGAVIVTGGHTEEGTDLLFDGSLVTRIRGPRHPEGSAHGSGCTHSSALAAGLALGLDLVAAARLARTVAAEAVANGPGDVGAGPGPVSAWNLSDAREWARSVAGAQSSAPA